MIENKIQTIKRSNNWENNQVRIYYKSKYKFKSWIEMRNLKNI